MSSFGLAIFEDVSRDTYDETKVFNKLIDRGYKPQWVWSNRCGIRVFIDGIQIIAYVEILGDLHGWTIKKEGELLEHPRIHHCSSEGRLPQ